MLSWYITQTQRLLQNPKAPSTLYSTADVTDWINIARGQLAGDAKCVRRIATIATVAGQQSYNFSALTISDTSVAGAINIRRIYCGQGTGQARLNPRPWEWFDLYHLNNINPQQGQPTVWAQYGQGSAGIGSITGIGTGTMSSGSFYVDPIPDQVYTLNCDAECYPAALVADTDVECIPYLFSDAVPFFAAYYALLSSQTSARQADAERLFNHYETFVGRARSAANPSVNRWQYEGAKDPAQNAKLGIKPRAEAG